MSNSRQTKHQRHRNNQRAEQPEQPGRPPQIAQPVQPARSRRTIIRIEDLIGSKIITADGRRLGKVVDIHITREREPEVIALVYGQSGWLYRLGVLVPFSRLFGLPFTPHTVAWKDVATFEHLTVKLKPGYEIEAEKAREGG